MNPAIQRGEKAEEEGPSNQNPHTNELYQAVYPFLSKKESGSTSQFNPTGQERLNEPTQQFEELIERKISSFCKRKSVIARFPHADFSNADFASLAKNFAKERWAPGTLSCNIDSIMKLHNNTDFIESHLIRFLKKHYPHP